MEILIGQFSSKSSVRVWECVPGLKGIGFGQIFGITCVLTYYCPLCALGLSYMFDSFASKLPWAECREEYGKDCVDSSMISNANIERNITGRSSSEYYFLKIVMKQKENIDDGIGNPDLYLSLFLLLSWAITFVILARGISSTGKAAYFLAIFPYIVIIVLLIKAITLDGALNGIKFLVTPKWEELLKAKVYFLLKLCNLIHLYLTIKKIGMEKCCRAMFLFISCC